MILEPRAREEGNVFACSLACFHLTGNYKKPVRREETYKLSNQYPRMRSEKRHKCFKSIRWKWAQVRLGKQERDGDHGGA
jgi:hypothetical protein